MVYVNSDGSINQGPRPWGVNRLYDAVWSFLDTLVLFFETLIPSSERGRRQAINNGGSVGYGSSRSSRSNNNRGNGSNIHGLRRYANIPPPPMCGSCSGGSCG